MPETQIIPADVTLLTYPSPESDLEILSVCKGVLWKWDINKDKIMLIKSYFSAVLWYKVKSNEYGARKISVSLVC